MVKSNDLYQSDHNFETGVRVEEALMSFDPTRFDLISVVAFCGIIELTGTVSNYFDKALAMQLARQVAGVSTVVESIQVLQKDDVRRPAIGHRQRPIRSYYTSTSHRNSRRIDFAIGTFFPEGPNNGPTST